MNYPTELDDKVTDKQLERLRKYYNITGDGVARLRLDKAVTDDKFKESIRKISNIQLDEE